MYGPKYSRSRREAYVLINFSFGQAKLAMVVTKKCVMCQLMWCLFERAICVYLKEINVSI